MHPFWLALTLSLTAEIGDKSQLLVLGYATRFTFRQMAVGIFLGTAAVLLLPALLGNWIGHLIPVAYVHILSGLCFLFFGFWTLRGEESGKEIHTRIPYPVIAIAVTLFLAEFGDKTMLATAALATSWDWLPVWLGATTGMVLADLGTVILGRILHKALPEKQIRWLAAILFFIFAAWSFFKGLNALKG